MSPYDLFEVSISIPHALFITALGLSLIGFLLAKSPSSKRNWVFAVVGELLVAFLLLKLLPCFYSSMHVCILLFCGVTLALILAGIGFFKPLTK